MRIKFLIAFFFFFCSRMMQVSARDKIVDTLQSNVILGRYLEKLNRIYNKYQHVPDSVEIPVGYSPYYYKILSPALLYRAALRQHFLVRHEFSDSLDCTDRRNMSLSETDSILELDQEINELLFHTYRQYPGLVYSTEDQVHQVGVIQEDVTTQLDHEAVLVDQTDLPTFVPDIGDSVVVIPKKPNFWKYYSNSSLNFYQYYYSENWYKDRTDNYYNMLAVLKLGLSYNNKSKFTWENNLEMRLGFRSFPKDTEHQFRTADDLIRLNSKIGYRATEHW